MPRQRNPRLNPQPGDVLGFKRWRIRVTGVEAESVTFEAHHPGREKLERCQGLTVWRTWTKKKKAKVVEREPEPGECLKVLTLSGPCRVCQEYVMSTVHLVDLHLFCERHCPCCQKESRSV